MFVSLYGPRGRVWQVFTQPFISLVPNHAPQCPPMVNATFSVKCECTCGGCPASQYIMRHLSDNSQRASGTLQLGVFTHRFHHLSAVLPAGYMVAHNRGKSYGNGSRENGWKFDKPLIFKYSKIANWKFSADNWTHKMCHAYKQKRGRL